MEDNNVVVDIIHTSLVKPASPSPQAYLFLPACDLLLRHRNYNRRVLFYKQPASASGEDEYPLFISTLQRSLSEALAHFYPFAGRLAVGTADGRLSVDCNDQGAEFVEACIHGVSFSELQRSNFDMQPYFVHLTRWASYSSQHHEGSAPLFSVQVTRFDCGNIALGIAHSHVVADGSSLWHFMSSWAECARGESLSLYPSHDRTLLMIENYSLEKAFFDPFEDAQDNEEDHKVEATKQRAFSFTKEMVTRLKKRANDQFSSYEVLCAHIWKKATNARGHKRNVRIDFGNVVNMRGRMEPPLPQGYFGNVVQLGWATASMGELQDEDLATTASRIRNAINSCSNSSMQQFLHFVELHDNIKHFFSKFMLNGVRMRVSSSPKFPMLRTNFGWEKPLAVRSVVVENGKVGFYTGPSGLGSVDVCMSLSSQAMQQLESDPSFLTNF